MKDMSFENWNQSYLKWTDIVRRVENRIPFDDLNGWNFIEPCGYCKEYGITTRDRGYSEFREYDNRFCMSCPLYADYGAICATHLKSESVFSNFINCMEHIQYCIQSKDQRCVKYKAAIWFEAEVFARIVLAAILDHGHSMGYTAYLVD